MSEIPKAIIYYRAGSLDAFAAACLIARTVKETTGHDSDGEFIPVAPPELPDLDKVHHRPVIILGFSWDVETMQKVAARALSLLWVDHHADGRPALRGLMRTVFAKTIDSDIQHVHVATPDRRVELVWGATGWCTAGLTWVAMHGDSPDIETGVAKLLGYLNDIELGNYELPAAEYIGAALAFRWMPLSTMPALHYEAFWNEDPLNMIQMGAQIVAYRKWEQEAPKWPT